ncbi:hypothetical protein [Staphylococcus sp. 11261D007BR]
MRETINALIHSEQGSYEIYLHTGISQGIIFDLRAGYRSLDDMNLKDAESLYNYACRILA